MMANVLLEQALQLPPAERESLCEHIWESLENQDDSLTPEQEGELKRRIAHAKAHPEEGILWEELREKWGRKWGWKV
jgi:putative addiction module component (TIGR02574 family)